MHVYNFLKMIFEIELIFLINLKLALFIYSPTLKQLFKNSYKLKDL